MSFLREALSAARGYAQSELDPNPRQITRTSGRGVVRGRSKNAVKRVQPPDNEIERYWRLYETVPLIRAPFNQFADDVIGDGYEIEANSPETATFLNEWAETGAVIAGERNRDLLPLLRSIPTQTLARGTTLLEHAPAREDSSKIAGLAFINPATVTPYLQPDTSLLLQPDDTDYENVKKTDDGKAAAYVQYDRDEGYNSSDSEERRFTQKQVTKIANDPNIGEVFGNSDIEPIANRVDGIRNKLADNEQAIESAAWRQLFIQFQPTTVADGTGGETIVGWDKEDMDEVVDGVAEMEPGGQAGMEGDIDVENIPGEVADILKYLEFDVKYILTAMPSPTYAVGFEQDINQFVTVAQESRHEQRVEAFRERIERALQPVFKKIAVQNSHDPAGVEIRLDAGSDDPLLDETEQRLEAAKAMNEATGGQPSMMFTQPEIRKLVFGVGPQVGSEVDMNRGEQSMQNANQDALAVIDESNPVVQEQADAMGLGQSGFADDSEDES